MLAVCVAAAAVWGQDGQRLWSEAKEVAEESERETESESEEESESEMESESGCVTEKEEGKESETENEREPVDANESEGELGVESEVEIGQESERELEFGSEAETESGPGTELESGSEIEPELGSEAEVESESKIELESGSEIEQESGNEAEAESELGTELENGSEIEPEPGSEAEAESESKTELESEIEPEPGSEAEVESESETELGTELESMEMTETDNEGEAEQGTESESELEIESETESEMETEPVYETETESERETELEAVTESEDETEAESETAPSTEKAVIEVISITPDYPGGTRPFDGTNHVNLRLEIQKAEPGNVKVTAEGTARSADAGTWKVDVTYQMTGEDADRFELKVPEEQPEITITPKVLHVQVSDAWKEYFTEVATANLEYEQTVPVTVSGFMKDGSETTELPAGFQLPEVMIDTDKLAQDSPMFRKGEPIVYQDALVLKRNADGSVSGNPTENYCYDLTDESSYQKGDIRLKSPALEDGDYQLQIVGSSYIDEQGRLWLEKGSRILAVPTGEKQYTDGEESGELETSGTWSFSLTRKNKKGSVTACSKQREISFYIDEKLSDTENSSGEEKGGEKRNTDQNKDEKEGKKSNVSENTDDTTQKKPDAELGLSQTADTAPQGGNAVQTAAVSVTENKNSIQAVPEQKTETQNTAMKNETGQNDPVQNDSVQSDPAESDNTKPEITISEPDRDGRMQISIKDENLDTQTVRWTLKGQKNGQITLTGVQRMENGILFLDFPALEDQAEMDDWYQITITATDQAGNQSQETKIFSINRYGAIFQSDPDTEKKQETFYLNQSFEPVMEVKNVETLEKQKLICIWNGQVRELQPDVDYIETVTTEKNGWKKYSYRILKNCFSEEGTYSVIASAADSSGNEKDSRSDMGTLSFVIDRTPPTAILTQIEDGKTYRSEECPLTVQARDNNAVDRIELWVNGKLVQETSGEALTYSLNSSEEWQEVKARAVDAAGNECWTEPVKVKVQKEDQKPLVLKKASAELGGGSIVIEAESQEMEKMGKWAACGVLSVSVIALFVCICLIRRMDFQGKM